MTGVRSGGSITKFKNTCILTESKTFYPHEKCQTYVNKTIFARHHSLCNNHYRPLYFILVPISFRCPRPAKSHASRVRLTHFR